MSFAETENQTKNTESVIFYTNPDAKKRMEHLKKNFHINWSGVLRDSLDRELEHLEKRFRVKPQRQ